MFETWSLGEKVAGAAIGLGALVFITRRLAGSPGASERVGLDATLPERHERVVRAALLHEADPAVLHALAARLGAAGYHRSAAAAARRAGELSPIIAARGEVAPSPCGECNASSRPAPVWWAAGDFSVAGAAIAAGANAMRAGAGDGEVRGAQQILTRLGYQLQPSGILGPDTRAAIREFQRRQGLGDSGSLDPRTLAALATVAGSAG